MYLEDYIFEEANKIKPLFQGDSEEGFIVGRREDLEMWGCKNIQKASPMGVYMMWREIDDVSFFVLVRGEE